jgi:hypothetical protein
MHARAITVRLSAVGVATGARFQVLVLPPPEFR